MRRGDRAGLLRVIDEVTLHIIRGAGADDLDGVFVGTHGAVRTETVEECEDGAGILGRKSGIVVQAGVGHVVLNADGEMVLGLRLLQFVEDSLHHGGRELFGREPVAPTNDERVVCELR
jgi:hypothetical protein